MGADNVLVSLVGKASLTLSVSCPGRALSCRPGVRSGGARAAPRRAGSRQSRESVLTAVCVWRAGAQVSPLTQASHVSVMMETRKTHSRPYTHIPFTSVRQTASAEPRVISGQISGQGQPRTVLCMLSADAASLSEERRRLAVGIVLAEKLFPDVLAVHCRPPLGDGAISNSSLHGGVRDVREEVKGRRVKEACSTGSSQEGWSQL